MPYDIEIEEWYEEQQRRLEAQQEIEDIDYQIENPDEDKDLPQNRIGRL